MNRQAAFSVYDSWLNGRTRRKHTMQSILNENTADHSWGVVMLLIRYAPWAPKHVYVKCVMHDAGERAAADIPAHLCWELPELKAVVQKKEDEHIRQCLSTEGAQMFFNPPDHSEECFLEILDRAEFVLSCHHEACLGNSLVLTPRNRAFARISEKTKELKDEDPYKTAARYLLQDLRKLLGKED